MYKYMGYDKDNNLAADNRKSVLLKNYKIFQSMEEAIQFIQVNYIDNHKLENISAEEIYWNLITLDRYNNIDNIRL